MLPVAIERWEYIAKTGDFEPLKELLASDVVFESPIVHTPQIGRDLTRKYLIGAVRALRGPDSQFIHRWIDGHSAVLELEAQIEGVKINAVDIISWNADDRINHFKVMVRPLKAINVLHQAMGQMLAADAYE